MSDLVSLVPLVAQGAEPQDEAEGEHGDGYDEGGGHASSSKTRRAAGLHRSFSGESDGQYRRQILSSFLIWLSFRRTLTWVPSPTLGLSGFLVPFFACIVMQTLVPEEIEEIKRTPRMATNGKKRGPTLPERRRAAAAAAMPEVKKLVKRFGRMALSNCITKIAAWERESKKLSAMRNEVKQLEQKLRV
jgi:hypothetical protein